MKPNFELSKENLDKLFKNKLNRDSEYVKLLK